MIFFFVFNCSLTFVGPYARRHALITPSSLLSNPTSLPSLLYLYPFIPVGWMIMLYANTTHCCPLPFSQTLSMLHLLFSCSFSGLLSFHCPHPLSFTSFSTLSFFQHFLFQSFSTFPYPAPTKRSSWVYLLSRPFSFFPHALPILPLIPFTITTTSFLSFSFPAPSPPAGR